MDFPMRINVVSKRGMGLVIIIVIVLLSGLAIIGLANYKFVERTTLDVGVSVTGDKALFYAQSAVEEAIHIASLQVNDPSSDLFKTIRSQAQTGPFEINYPVPNLAAELGSVAGFKYSLEGGSVKSKVMFQNSFEKMIYEKYGTIEFVAEVSVKIGFGRKVYRKFRERIGFRMQLISAPRPYDQATVYVQDISGWIDPDGFNGQVSQSEDFMTTKIPSKRKEWKDKINDAVDKANQAPANCGIDAQEFHDAIDTPALQGPPSGFMAFPNPMIALSVVPKLDLADLYLSDDLAIFKSTLFQKAKAVDDSEDNLKDAINSVDSCSDKDKVLQATKEFATTTHELSEWHAKRIQYFIDFQKLVRSFGEPQRTKIGKFYEKLDSNAKWKNKATYIVREDGGLQSNFNKLRDKVSTLNGVVYVENSSQKLKLSGSFKGKVIIVTQGDVEVENLSPADQTKDIVSVISYGKMRTSGNINASLMPQAELQIVNVNLVGNLIFNRIWQPDQLKGLLQYDPRIFSGTTSKGSDANAKKTYYYVAFSPMSIGSDIERKSSGIDL